MKKIVLGLVINVVVFSCASPYRSTNKTYKKQAKAFAKVLAKYPLEDSANNVPFIGTTNFNLRKPNFVILHHTAQNSCDETLRTFTTTKSEVSAHYLICKDGTVHHMLNDYLRAWQAGVSKWGSATDINSISIGIEIDNNGFEPFTDEQISSLLQLLDRLKRAYNIPAANFIGHADIAPGRKVDPNKYFPWQKLAENGFGFWYDTTGVQVPADFDAMQALRLIGYDLKKPEAAIQSFKLHFVPNDSTKVMNDDDKKILVDLEKKYE
ncbi:MAG TPA: N-acetylmuramoyl-L-alanine amidase [Chitinophagaceae bacterium]|nr:N-acetylmuramoyl-L-alanine amidase [Chitinophagaceae bacterium]